MRGYFYFCATYACPGPNAIAPSFETRFARLEYVGLGSLPLEKVIIQWPNGITQTLTGLAPNRYYVIVQGQHPI